MIGMLLNGVFPNKPKPVAVMMAAKVGPDKWIDEKNTMDRALTPTKAALTKAACGWVTVKSWIRRAPVAWMRRRLTAVSRSPPMMNPPTIIAASIEEITRYSRFSVRSMGFPLAVGLRSPTMVNAKRSTRQLFFAWGGPLQSANDIL